jgi:hypothetical protein
VAAGAGDEVPLGEPQPERAASHAPADDHAAVGRFLLGADDEPAPRIGPDGATGAGLSWPEPAAPAAEAAEEPDDALPAPPPPVVAAGQTSEAELVASVPAPARGVGTWARTVVLVAAWGVVANAHAQQRRNPWRGGDAVGTGCPLAGPDVE